MLRTTQRQRTLLLAALFVLLGQFFAIAHAAEFGVHEHEHDGVLCFSIINDDQDGLITPAAPMLSAVAAEASQALAWLPKPVAPFRSRVIRPPPTGPPSIQPI